MYIGLPHYPGQTHQRTTLRYWKLCSIKPLSTASSVSFAMKAFSIVVSYCLRVFGSKESSWLNAQWTFGERCIWAAYSCTILYPFFSILVGYSAKNHIAVGPSQSSSTFFDMFLSAPEIRCIFTAAAVWYFHIISGRSRADCFNNIAFARGFSGNRRARIKGFTSSYLALFLVARKHCGRLQSSTPEQFTTFNFLYCSV